MEQEIKLLKKYNIALKNAYTKEREKKKNGKKNMNPCWAI